MCLMTHMEIYEVTASPSVPDLLTWKSAKFYLFFFLQEGGIGEGKSVICTYFKDSWTL
jgi:hypothetical protein